MSWMFSGFNVPLFLVPLGAETPFPAQSPLGLHVARGSLILDSWISSRILLSLSSR